MSTINCKCTKFDERSHQKVIYKTKLYNCKSHFIKALHMEQMVHVLLNALNAWIITHSLNIHVETFTLAYMSRFWMKNIQTKL